MQKMGWFGLVRGHSRSTAMSPFNIAHTTSYSTLIETMFTVFEIQPVICRKSPILTYPTCIWRVTPVEFRGDLRHQKTRVTGVSCGVVCTILRFAILVEHRLVTDRRRPMASTADAQHRAVKNLIHISLGLIYPLNTDFVKIRHYYFLALLPCDCRVERNQSIDSL